MRKFKNLHCQVAHFVVGATLPDDTIASRNLLVVLRPLELWYRKDGPISKDYGDQFHPEQNAAPEAGVSSRSSGAISAEGQPQAGPMPGGTPTGKREGDRVNDKEKDSGTHQSKRAAKKERFTFPTLLPGSRIVIGEELVEEVNALASKYEQIQFLIAILPPTDQKEKRLSDRQLYAIRLLGLTESDVVIGSLLDRLDFMHTGDAWPASHALGRLGERSVEPVVKKLESVANDLQKTIMLGNALIEIKNKDYPMFIDELRRRKDIKLSDEILNQLLDIYRNSPDS